MLQTRIYIFQSYFGFGKYNIFKKEILVSGRLMNASKNLLLTYDFSKLVKKISFATYTNFFVMECRPAPDLSQTRTSILADLDIARPEPDQIIDCHGIFPHRYLY